MSGLDWNVAAVSVGAAAIAAMITAARGLRRRRRRRATARAYQPGERRIEVMAIDQDVEQEPNA
jgi:hypothetical protein